MHTSTSVRTAPAVASANRFRWRVVDIVVAAVLGVAIGLVFWGWNTVGGIWFGAMDALTPGLGGIAVGIWLIGGVIGGLVIRKPGAALLVELIAAIVSALIGNVWGVTTIFSGLAQGLGAELIFLAFLYLRFTLPVSMLAGAGAGSARGCWSCSCRRTSRSPSSSTSSISPPSSSRAPCSPVSSAGCWCAPSPRRAPSAASPPGGKHAATSDAGRRARRRRGLGLAVRRP